MKKIIIDLKRLNEQDAADQNIASCNFIDERNPDTTIARDVLAPLAVDQLFMEEGDYHQASAASFGKLGDLFMDRCSCSVGGGLWFCADDESRRRFTLPDGFSVYAFGRCAVGACWVLILKNQKTQAERAYLVRSVNV